MNEFWLSLQSIPPSGLTKNYEDQSVWASLLKEFDVVATVIKPITATVEMHHQDAGIFFKGRVSGQLSIPCNKCSEDSFIKIDSTFDSFEPFPGDGFDEEDDLSTEVDDAVVRLAAQGNGIEVNPLALAWEELVLALPVKPVCEDDCKGLCPNCGTNLNTGSCDCEQESGDPRFAALRSLHLKK